MWALGFLLLFRHGGLDWSGSVSEYADFLPDFYSDLTGFSVQVYVDFILLYLTLPTLKYN